MSQYETDPDSPNAASTGMAADLPAKRGRGRPKGSRNKKRYLGLTESEQMALEESRRVVQAGTNLTATQVVNRAQIKTAATGGTMAQKSHLERIAKLEQKQYDATQKLLETAEEYVRLAELSIEQANDRGIQDFERHLLPHPADMEVDFEKREVRFRGPATTLERRIFNEAKAAAAEERQWLLETRTQLENTPCDWRLQFLYLWRNDRYLTYFEKMPERHRPESLPRWQMINQPTLDEIWKGIASLRPRRKRSTTV